MPVSRSFLFPARAVALLCVVSLLPAAGFAQEAPPAQPKSPSPFVDYSKPKSALTIVGPYTGRDVPTPNFANAPRIEQLVKNGQIMLSLNDAIALALENNLDLAIARYNLNIADTDVLRAKSGGATRGVNTGLVSGTPGGGGVGSTSTQGGGAGGTTTGAGGAGSGTGGIVSSTVGAGAPIDSFDPVLTGSLGLADTATPTSNTITTGGVANLRNKGGQANFGYQQGFQTGSLFSLSFNNTRSTTSGFTNLLPAVESSFRAQVRQHLLSGFGFGPNNRFIRIAKINREISDVSFRNQVIATVSQIQNIYWDLVNAYEDVKVKERSLALANKTLSDNRKQVEIGTLAPIEITRAQAEVATRQQDLIVAQTNLQLQQLLMKNAVTRNLSDPTLAAAPVIPTDVIVMPEVEQVRPIQDLINEALSRRPDIASQRMDLRSRDISKKSARNALLPTLDLIGWYGGSGLAGDPNLASGNVCGQSTADPVRCIPNVRRGFGGAFGDAFDQTNPDKGIALSLSIPIRNRAAQADQVRSELEYRQAEMRLQQVQNQIGIEVRNAAFALQQNRARVDAAKSAREFQLQNLDAEQKRYALGASTNTLVLQAQRDLATAEGNYVGALAAYEKSRVELDRVTGYTLDRNGIQMDDAVTGDVNKTPTVPGVAPNANIQPTIMQQQQTQNPQQ